MGHDEARERLWELHDGRLPEAEAAEVRAHLGACADCRAELESWRAAARALFPGAPAPRPEETEAFVRRVLASLPEGAPEPAAAGRSWPALPRLALAGACAAAAALLLLRTPRPAQPAADEEAYAAAVLAGQALEEAVWEPELDGLEPELEELFL